MGTDTHTVGCGAPWEIARAQALEILAPHCERIQVAGSIRRGKKTPKDVEIVAIPKRMRADLFDQETVTDPGFCEAVNQWTKIKGEPTGKYTQRLLPNGVKLDLFLATENNWGLILAIRTGPASYSKDVLVKRVHEMGYQMNAGYLWQDGQADPVPVREETDLYDLLCLRWRDPEERGA